MSASEATLWIEYAKADLDAARILLEHPRVFTRHTCFYAQQSVEKALKAILIWLGIGYPYTHDLDRIRDLIPDGWRVKLEFPDLAALTVWAVAVRYPSHDPNVTVSEARDALSLAEGVYAAVEREMRERAAGNGGAV